MVRSMKILRAFGPGRFGRRGFTAVELILVVFLLALVTAIAIPGMSPVVRSLRLRGAAWQVAGDLRLARQRAVTLKKRFRVCVTGCAIGVPAGAYSIERDEGAPGSANWVSDSGAVTRLPQDVALSVSANPVFTVIGTASPSTLTLTNVIGTYQVTVAQPGRVRVCEGLCAP